MSDFQVNWKIIPLSFSASVTAPSIFINLSGYCVIQFCQIIRMFVMPAGKRASSAKDGKLKSIHGAWIPAIPAGMTILEKMDHLI